MNTPWLKRRVYLQWVLLLALAPLLLTADRASGGPGADAAVATERAAQCSLPPFLNVALTERPNIMVLYDNASSMSLQGYSKAYNPETHYYGLYNADTCYSYTAGVPGTFTKAAIYPVEVVDPGTGPSKPNPAVDYKNLSTVDSDIRDQHYTNKHFCTDSSYPWSGNFLNWFTMRRVDLLRKAFTGGLSGGGAGNRAASSLEGESAFAPCFNKSYLVPDVYGPLNQAVKPFYVVDPKFGQIVFGKVKDGDIILGFSCASGTEVISKRTAPPATMLAERSFKERFMSLAEMVQAKLSRMTDWVQSQGTQVASLFPVMNDAGLALVGAPAAPDLQLVSWTVEDGSGNALSNAYPGQTIVVSGLVKNISTNKDFAGDAGDGFSVVLGVGPGSSSGDSPIGKCAIPAIAKSSSTTITCTLAVPTTYLPTTYKAPDATLGLYVNYDNSPAESSVANNWGSVPFYLVEEKPDLQPANITLSESGGIVTVKFDLLNKGTATGTFDVDVFWSADTIAGNGDDDPSVTCQSSLKSAQGATDSYSCDVPLPGWCTGDCTLFVSVDTKALTVPGESDTTNNIGSSTYVVPDPSNWEIGLTGVAIPAGATAGGNLKVAYSIKNSGGKDSDPAWVDIEVVDSFGVVVATASCFHGVIPGKSTLAFDCSVYLLPTIAAGTYTVKIDLEPSDGVGANNSYTGATKISPPSAVCALEKDCKYDINVDFFGLRRTGILWSFNKKELPAGQFAPANLGLTKFTDWFPLDAGLCNGGGGCTGNEFDGIQEGQSMSNSVVAHLEQASASKTTAPLARMLLNVIKYYQQRAAESTFKKASDSDAFLFDVDAAKNGKAHNCRRNYILMITDGLAYGDDEPLPVRADSPAHDGSVDLRFYATNLSDPAETPAPVAMPDATLYDVSKVPDASMLPVVGKNGSYRLDNVAYYANYQGGVLDALGNALGSPQKGVDLRPDITGLQTVQTVIVHTFSDGGTSTTNYDRSKRLLERAAINGSYVERDGRIGVTSQQEWDADYDGLPDAYFQAKEGDDVGEVILNALNSILLKTASGTSVSVIASTARGEGAIYQSYFRPTTADSGREINWIGFLQALWVDKYNNLREDTVNDGKLVLTQDRVLETVFNDFSKETFAYFYYTDANGNRISSYDGPYSLNQVKPIFESGRVLHKTEPKDRVIYTWGHYATDSVPSTWPRELTDAEVDNCGASGNCLKKFMWPTTNVYYGSVSMTTALARWVRGDDQADATFRKRSMTIDGVTNTWKLGDIVYSTPTVVGSPEERYDLLYGDRQEGYSEFYKGAARRKRMVYVGANDGMLHAFNGGLFREGDDPSTSAKEAAWYQVDPGQVLGQELWSYVPGSLLANLRMLADAGYDATCHVYFVDLKPKVTDVQIFFDSAGDPIDKTAYPNGWGTILIGGMRLGCGKTEFASYFILDITRPEKPYLLAEFGDQSVTSGGTLQPAGVSNLGGLDFSFFYPTVLRVDDPSLSRNTNDGLAHKKAGRWFMVVGSGPDQVQHTSLKATSYVYAFDLTKLGLRTGGKDGTPTPRKLEDYVYAYNKFADGTALPAYTVVSNGLTADLDADFGVDSAYLVVQTDVGYPLGINRWTGGIWRLSTYEDPDPTKWKLNRFFNTADGTRYQPIVGAPGITRDPYGNIWVYFGTGRFMHNGRPTDRINDLRYGDATNFYQQALYGVIDPCWDVSKICTVALPLTRTNLVKTDGFRLQLSKSKLEYVDCNGVCPKQPAVASPWRLDNIIDLVRLAPNYGWYRDMPDGPLTGGTTWEMSYNKPAVAGQLVLFTTYMPGEDTNSCTIGGLSNLYVLNYQTGTAAKEDPFGNFSTTSTATFQEIKAEKRGFGKEPPSPPSIFGKQVFVQGSNAKITGIQTQAQFKLKPRIRGMVEE